VISRLGAVSYLNARPLTAALPKDRSLFAVEYCVPSQCAADLHAGRIELGLIPSIEYARGPEPYRIVPGVAIAACGAVLTVRLFWRGPFGQIRRVALDTSSRTSAALLRILMRERFHLEPEFVEVPPDLPGMLAVADAALLIGDAVFRTAGVRCDSIDLGQEWEELTGLPFVFAFWAGRPDALTIHQAEALVQARDRGREQLGQIARAFWAEKESFGLPASFYESYLADHIRFDLGEAELEGLRTFYRLAQAHALIESVPDLQFYARTGVKDCGPTARLATGGG